MGAFEEADFPDAPPVLPTVIEGACGWPVREKVNRAAPTRPKPFGVLIFDNWSERGRLRKRRRPQTSKEAALTFGVRDWREVRQR